MPFVIVIGMLLAAVGSARAGKNALVEVGIVGVPPPNFQNVLLNVQSVRINPHANVGPGNPRWNNIPVPPGIEGAGQSADLQIDLNTSQNVPQLFNTTGVQAGTYRSAELLLDPNNPGTLVPNCPLAPPLGNASDGCIKYPIQLAAGTSVISVTNTGPGGLIQPGNRKLTELVLQVSMTIVQAPTTPGGAYTVAVTLASPPTNPVEMGVVKGFVNVKQGSGSGSSPTGKVRGLAVTAEAIGTNTPIASAPVKNGKFTLELPAAGGPAAPGFGTLYDLAVAGGLDTYAAQRLLPLYPGQSITADFTGSNSLTGSQKLGNITGTIYDNCVGGRPIVGATLQLLIPPDSNPTANCFPSETSPESFLECVAVATANTDNTGYFPLPGTVRIPAEFNNVPIHKQKHYVMEVSAPGYDNLFVYASPGRNNKGGACSTDGTTFTACSLALNTGYISGTIPIEPPISGQTTLVQVFAEDTGTNNIESALPAPIIVRSSNPGTVSFTLNVPTEPIPPATVRTFDLFATTIDLYHGTTDPYQGHTIAVLSDVTGPAQPSKPGACSTATATFDQTITCIGHGSITAGPDGVANADLGTSVVLSKGNVQITNTPVQNQSANSNPLNSYSFCIPADTYQVQRLQLPTPDPNATPSAMPTPFLDGSAVTVTIPPAPLLNAPTASPTTTNACPTTCQNPDGSCPGICNDVIQPL